MRGYYSVYCLSHRLLCLSVLASTGTLEEGGEGVVGGGGRGGGSGGVGGGSYSPHRAVSLVWIHHCPIGHQRKSFWLCQYIRVYQFESNIANVYDYTQVLPVCGSTY